MSHASESHVPVNHPLRPLYRVLAGLTGLYILVFGVVGALQTSGTGLFDRPDEYALGLRTNFGFALISIAAGLIIIGITAYGRNVDFVGNQIAGYSFAVMGMLMLALLRSDANFLNFSMATCIVSFVISLVLLAAGCYSKIDPSRGTVNRPGEAAAANRRS